MKTTPKDAARFSRPAKRSAAAPASAPGAVRPEERQRMIEQVAYLKAEKENFQGEPAKYWLEAEAEISARLGSP